MLLHSDTQLRFITKGDRNKESQCLEINSNRYGSYFHTTLSVAMCLPLIVVNNSIIGLPTDKFQRLITWLKERAEVANRQVIIVQRSDSNNNGINQLQARQVHFIRCSGDDNTRSRRA